MASDIKEVKQKLEIAHKKWKAPEKRTKRAWSYFKGNQWGSHDDRDDPAAFSNIGYKDKTVDNVIFANIRAIIPRLNYKNPKIYVRPEKKPFKTKNGIFDTIAASVYFELIMNHYYKVLAIKRECRKCLYDALLSPWGVMELGYTVKKEKIQGGELLNVNELITEDSPYVMRRDPKDLRVDPEAVDSHLHDASWIGLRWIKSLDDLKKDPRYGNMSGLKNNYIIKTDYTTSTIKGLAVDDNEGLDNIWGRVEGWTIWNKKDHRIMDVVKEHPKFLRNEKEWPLELEGFPVETLYFNENNTELYPIPDTWLVLDMQDELNRIGSMQMDHIRRISQRRYLAQEQSMGEEEMDKLVHGGDGTVAFTKTAPANAVVPLADATISQDIWMIRSGIKDIIRQTMGVSAPEALQVTKFDQATEPALMEQASQSIRGDQQDIFENFIIRIIEKLAIIIQQTEDTIEIPIGDHEWNDPEIAKYLNRDNPAKSDLAKIIGEDGNQVLLPWLELGKDKIQGKYIFDIEIGSTMPMNEQQMKNDVLTLSKAIGNNPYVKQREGLKEIFSAFNKTDPEKYLYTDQEVMQRMMAGREAQIKGEIAMDMPKRQVDLQKTQIKSQTAKDVAQIKSGDSRTNKAVDERTEVRKLQGKVLTDALKGFMRPKR